MEKKIKNIHFFAKGKRSEVFVGFLGKKKVALKIGARAEIEGKWLKLLNRKKIGPKLIFFNKNKLIYEFVEGERIENFLKDKAKIKIIIKKVLNQCRLLDKLKIDKKEMVNPYKHILIGKKNKVIMIDFERCKRVEGAKNVTQFCEYLMRKGIANRKKLTPYLKIYKNNQKDKNFKNILSNIL